MGRGLTEHVLIVPYLVHVCRPLEKTCVLWTQVFHLTLIFLELEKNISTCIRYFTVAIKNIFH